MECLYVQQTGLDGLREYSSAKAAQWEQRSDQRRVHHDESRILLMRPTAID